MNRARVVAIASAALLIAFNPRQQHRLRPTRGRPGKKPFKIIVWLTILLTATPIVKAATPEEVERDHCQSSPLELKFTRAYVLRFRVLNCTLF